MFHVLKPSTLASQQRSRRARRPSARGLVLALRVIGACLRKDTRSAWRERSTMLQTITLPVNYLILLSLFVLSGSNAPTAVVLLDTGPYAQAYVAAMQQAHSFHLLFETAAQAEAQYQAGTLVAIVTIPASFDQAVATQQPVQVGVQINNLNEDLTDDVHRAMGLVTTSFYAQAFPGQVTLTVSEHDQYSQDTGYIPYLAISIMVIALLVTGLLQAGMAAAREWEQETMKELLLAPSSIWPLLLGKILSTVLIGLPSLVIVLAVIVGVAGDWPVNFPLVIAIGLLSLLVFATAGACLGMALKDRGNLTTISRALAVPLLFVSGLFGPVSFNTSAVQLLARATPIHYAIVLQQAAFKGFVSNTLAPLANVLILAGFGLAFFLLAGLTVRVSKVAH